jgi:site-specific recombinase
MSRMSHEPPADRSASAAPLQACDATAAAKVAREAALGAAVAAVAQAVAAVRPAAAWSPERAGEHVNRELRTLCADAARIERLRLAVRELLAIPTQHAFFAEAGLRSAKGFALELASRVGRRLLPLPAHDGSYDDVVQRVTHPQDHLWLDLVTPQTWACLLKALAPAADDACCAVLRRSLAEAARMLSYRLAGCALDRELLIAEPALERHESPFLALNALLVPALEQPRITGTALSHEQWRDAEVLLAQCETALARVRRRVRDIGVSIRLTYLIARMDQLVARLRVVLAALAERASCEATAALLRELVASAQQRHEVGRYIGETVSLLARNVTDHAARHGEHYIAQDRSQWLHMARAAAGGGVVIAFMALAKLQLALLHLPPLTAGIVYGLNYGLGFVLIHMLGFVVATKQPAMTAAAIASTLEDTPAKRLDRLADLAQNTVRTQFVAVLGNVGLAFPLACCIALAWATLLGTPVAPPEKLHKMLAEIHPLASGALFFAAIAGVGLFLSGLVAGYFDNQARYLELGERVARSPRFAWLGDERARRLGDYVDAHYGAILGNLFFGMYLGLVGAVGVLTGLPVDIRHVAFSSANVGTALATLGWQDVRAALPWAVAGVAGIAVVNLAVSFALALYVAVKSRQLGFAQLWQLAGTLLARFARSPMSFFRAP